MIARKLGTMLLTAPYDRVHSICPGPTNHKRWTRPMFLANAQTMAFATGGLVNVNAFLVMEAKPVKRVYVPMIALVMACVTPWLRCTISTLKIRAPILITLAGRPITPQCVFVTMDTQEPPVI